VNIFTQCTNSNCKCERYLYVEQYICPFCKEPLLPIINENIPQIFINSLNYSPSSISNSIYRLLISTSNYKKLNYISDVFISGMRLAGDILIGIYEKEGLQNDEIDEKIQKINTKETHGAWPDLIEKLYLSIVAVNQSEWFDNYLLMLGRTSSKIKKEKQFDVENTFTDEYGKVQKVKSSGTPMQLLVNFRNKYLGHGTVISDEESLVILNTYLPIFIRFLEQISFLNNLQVITNNGKEYKGLYYDIEPGELIISNENLFSITCKYHIYTSVINSVNTGNYFCKIDNCNFNIHNVGLRIQQLCPSCSNQMLLNEDLLLDDLTESIINHYPYVIAYPYKRAVLEQDPYKKIHLLKETFLNYLKYLGLLTASEYFNVDIKIKEFNSNFRELLFRPQFGYWNKFIRDSVSQLNEANHQWFIKELPGYFKKIEIDVYESNSTILTPIGELIHFRNSYLGHGMVPSDDECLELWSKYEPILKNLLIKMDFCRSYTMVCYDNLRMWRLMGVEIEPITSNHKTNIKDRVQLVNAEGNTLSLVPFFVLPGEFFRQDTASKSKLMVYEQNTGKRIIFFSPESLSDETSGIVLERLNFLLSDKDMEAPYDEHGLTQEILKSLISNKRADVLKTLIKERKVLDGIYQTREDAELSLSSWIGAKAGLFFLSAEAGSGKTNLLVETSKQYANKNIDNLLIRANRMAYANLWEEIRFQLNLTQNFDLKSSIAFEKYTQENPFIVLIDGGNEHPQPDELLQSILNLLENNKGGHIKVVLSWRVNIKAEIPDIESEYDYLVYPDNLDGKDDNILARYCHWLKPLNKKELEGAWSSYITKNAKTHKPLFTLEDLTYFDRSLTDQLLNPLMLRLFLELFHGKNLPKQKGFVNIWALYHEKLIQE
jgi:hypothetical protein